MASLIHATAHGLVAGDAFRFVDLVPDTAGPVVGDTYYVLAAGLTADAFEFSTTPGGTAFVLTEPITGGDIYGGDTYDVINDGIMSPPDAPATPSAPSVTSALVTDSTGGVLVHLKVTLGAGTATDRIYEVQTTREYSGATPLWTGAHIYALSPGVLTLAIPALGATKYAARTRTTDVYGQTSAWSSATEHTTVVGPDSVGVRNVGATVTIEADGLHVADGAIFIEDFAGETVLTSSGFEGPWTDFIALGLYNAQFSAGTAGVLANGYNNTLPYWTVSTPVGSPVATFIAGGGVQITFTAVDQTKGLFSDPVPVLPDREYDCPVAASANIVSAGFVNCIPTVYWYQADGVTPSAVTASSPTGGFSYGATNPVASADSFLFTSPSDAAFARVFLEVFNDTAWNALDSLTLRSAGLLKSPSRNMINTVLAPGDWFMDDAQTTGRFTVATMRGGGTSFPGSPLTNDRYYRTDLNMWFLHDGTRWMSEQLFIMSVPNWNMVAAGSSATTAGIFRSTIPSLNGGSDIYLVNSLLKVFINGGTALSGSHSWTCVFGKVNSSNVNTTVATHTFNSGSSTVWRSSEVAINALLGSTSFIMQTDATKVGTPGNLIANQSYTYRIVAT